MAFRNPSLRSATAMVTTSERATLRQLEGDSGCRPISSDRAVPVAGPVERGTYSSPVPAASPPSSPASLRHSSPPFSRAASRTSLPSCLEWSTASAALGFAASRSRFDPSGSPPRRAPRPDEWSRPRRRCPRVPCPVHRRWRHAPPPPHHRWHSRAASTVSPVASRAASTASSERSFVADHSFFTASPAASFNAPIASPPSRA